VSKTLSPSDRDAQIKKWSEWMGALKCSGNYLAGGVPLKVDGAVLRTIRRELGEGFPTDSTLVTGTYFLEAGSLAEATDLAKGCPILDLDGSVEIRPTIERLH
jgi:hypothetical protein